MNNIIKRVSEMPNIPQPFCMRNWNKVSRDYDDLIFDFNVKGDFTPLVQLDKSRTNCEKDVVYIPSYINSKKDRVNGKQEGINIMSAVVGATISGIDKSKDRGLDYVDMLETFYNSKNGQDLFLNTTECETGGSFWYETYPNVLMSILSNLYHYDWLEEKLKIVAELYLKAIDSMGGDDVNFNHTAFDFIEMKTYDNGRWIEPEAAAGYAFVLYNSYVKYKDERYLVGCKQAMNFLENQDKNPYYELLLPYACYIAAKLNAEHSCSYNIAKMVNWCFDGDSAVRLGWGVVAERWGELDCHGLCGSLTDWGQRWDKMSSNAASDIDPVKSGYAFAGNTFSMAAGIIGLINYDTNFAHDVGKWFLNAANNSRLFYQNAHAKQSQSCAFFTDDENSCIAYEGLRKYWDSYAPYATGDPIRYSWGSIDLGLYGSSHVGMFGGVFGTTSDEKILKINCKAVDFIKSRDEDTYLIYNPYDCEKTVILQDLCGDFILNSIENKVIGNIVNGISQITIPADTAIVAICRKNK